MTMESKEIYYRLALSQVSGIGSKKQKILIKEFGGATEVFEASAKRLKSIAGIHEANALAIKSFSDFGAIDTELAHIEKLGIKVVPFDSPSFPNKLNYCIDGPALLFVKGNGDLNPSKSLSIIGTRANTDYGRKVCEELISEMKDMNITIFSGLAFGIDTIAHKACVKNKVPTFGVLAHGLGSIYPPAHKPVAMEMLEQGGLISEYFSHEKAEKPNFPTRNRIVAGIADATVVIETDRKGGSMITAEMAYSYNREVFCFPGRTIDSKSAGCNYLIKSLKSQMITSLKDIVEQLNWEESQKKAPAQRQLFVELTAEEEKVVNVLRKKEHTHVDELYLETGLSSAQMASSMLSLEMQNLIKVLPGKMISLN